jgi:hypothetical protein
MKLPGIGRGKSLQMGYMNFKSEIGLKICLGNGLHEF